MICNNWLIRSSRIQEARHWRVDLPWCRKIDIIKYESLIDDWYDLPKFDDFITGYGVFKKTSINMTSTYDNFSVIDVPFINSNYLRGVDKKGDYRPAFNRTDDGSITADKGRLCIVWIMNSFKWSERTNSFSWYI